MLAGFDLTLVLEAVGYLGLFALVFAESGLFFGFFLPGDSLLFTAGIIAAGGPFSIGIVLPVIFVAAVLGDSVGYSFGRHAGRRLFRRKDSAFFSQKNLDRSRAFYRRHGQKTIILARFVPVVRTFAPILAGVSDMRYATFLTFNVVGGLVWTLLLTLLGYGLGSAIPNVDRYLLPIVLVIIALSFAPVGWNAGRNLARGRADTDDEGQL